MYTTHRGLNIGSIVIIFPFSDSALKAYELDFQQKENRKAHHTEDYEAEELIVRRGQAFNVTVSFSRNYNKEADTVVVQLTTGIKV